MAANPLLPPVFDADDYAILPGLFGPDLPPAPGAAPADASGLTAAVGAAGTVLDDPFGPEGVQADAFAFRSRGEAQQSRRPADDSDGPAGWSLSFALSVNGGADAPDAGGITVVGFAFSLPAITSPDIEPMAKKPEGTPGGGPGNGGGGSQAPALAASYTSGTEDSGGSDYFNVRVEFFGEWSFNLMQAFGAAADFLSSVITTGLRDESGAFYTFDGPRGPTFSVDDVLIEAYAPGIDGEGGVLGRAGPYSVRDANTVDENTTVVGLMEFDSADALSLDAEGNWDAVVLHEMFHVLGFGTLWDLWDVSTGPVQVAGQDTRRPVDDVYEDTYLGTTGNAIYDQDRGAGMPADLLIETDGGSGTAGGHWDDDTYLTELMTGYLLPGDPYLADWTIASLNDIGLTTVDYSGGGTGQNALSGGIDLESATLLNGFQDIDATLIADYPGV